MARSCPEWVGADSDTPVPPRVRLRNFRDHNGICHLTGQRIGPQDKWETDHVIALIDGGQNRESNLAPALLSAHRAKTSVEVARKADIDAKAMAHVGIKGAGKTGLEGRSQTEKREAKILKTVEAGKIPSLPRRSLYADIDPPARPTLALPSPSNR